MMLMNELRGCFKLLVTILVDAVCTYWHEAASVGSTETESVRFSPIFFGACNSVQQHLLVLN